MCNYIYFDWNSSLEQVDENACLLLLLALLGGSFCSTICCLIYLCVGLALRVRSSCGCSPRCSYGGAESLVLDGRKKKKFDEINLCFKVY